MLLIKNVSVYTPSPIGIKDILICQGRIEQIADHISPPGVPCQILDAANLIAVPGFIDQHVHITGGGGEGGFHTRTPELTLSELIEGGITTVVGLLGTDGYTRSIENLYAKTCALCEEGITAFMLTGSYSCNDPYIIGSPDKDIVFVDKVLGMKLALSDHRAPNIRLEEFIRTASDVRVAGMLAGKPGFITLHMGDGKAALSPVFEALAQTNIPIKTFRPTHVNRNPYLLEDSYRFLSKGGYVDFTCQINKDQAPANCILQAKERGLPLDHITISSDGHGSWSNYDSNGMLVEMGISGVDSLYKELIYMVQELHMTLEETIPFLTSNVASALGLAHRKGFLQPSLDADLLLLNNDYSLHTVIANGELMMNQGHLQKKGTYEK